MKRRAGGPVIPSITCTLALTAVLTGCASLEKGLFPAQSAGTAYAATRFDECRYLSAERQRVCYLRKQNRALDRAVGRRGAYDACDSNYLNCPGRDERYYLIQQNRKLDRLLNKLGGRSGAARYSNPCESATLRCPGYDERYFEAQKARKLEKLERLLESHPVR